MSNNYIYVFEHSQKLIDFILMPNIKGLEISHAVSNDKIKVYIPSDINTENLRFFLEKANEIIREENLE
jgi:predicted metal-dependent hydrolase